MANVRILYDTDLLDASTISSSSQAGDLVDDNVIDPQLGRVWRSTSTSAWIKFYGSSNPITAAAIFGHNLTASAVVRLQGNMSNVWTSPAVNLLLPMAWDLDGVVLPTLAVFDNAGVSYWRILIEDTTNSAGYVQLGRVMMGLYYEPPRNVDDGFAVQWVDPSEGGAREGALGSYRVRQPYRTVSVDFTLTTAAQAQKFEAVFRRIGNHTPVMLALDPVASPSAQTLYCRLTSPLRTVWEMATHYSQGTLVFSEITE